MNLKIKQSNAFKKAVKKLPKQHKVILDNEIRQLAQNPVLGERKKGDLDFLRVHKFKLSDRDALLGYCYEESTLILVLLNLAIHENFYRDIKLLAKSFSLIER